MLPLSLRGTLYRLGPGRFERGGVQYASPLDGDGRVDRILIDGGRVEVASRFIETEQWKQEEREDKLLFRGAFGTAPHVSVRRLKNPANTALAWHGGQLLALWEGGCAHAIEPETLACLGPHDLGGAARVAPAFSLHPALDDALGLGGDAVCAHSKRCPATGRLVMLLTRFALGRTTLRFVEFEPFAFVPVTQSTHIVRGFTVVHDFALTDESVVFFAPPTELDIGAFRRGRSALDAATQRPGPTKLIVLPRGGAGVTRVADVPRCFVTHVAAARAAGGSAVEVDCFCTNELGADMDIYAFRARRFRLEPGAVEATAADASGGGASMLAEFPAVSEGGDVYYAGTSVSPMDSWVRWADGRRAVLDGGFHTEPVVAGEFLVGCVLVGGEHWLRVVDRDTMREAGRARLEGVNATGLHGLWIPG